MLLVSSLASRAVPGNPGQTGVPSLPAYAATKGAIDTLVKHWASSLGGRGIRVNAVAPGPVDTGMLTRFTHTPENKAALVTQVPMARLGVSKEQADAIVFIASEEASFITGHILNVDGGMTIS